MKEKGKRSRRIKGKNKNKEKRRKQREERKRRRKEKKKEGGEKRRGEAYIWCNQHIFLLTLTGGKFIDTNSPPVRVSSY